MEERQDTNFHDMADEKVAALASAGNAAASDYLIQKYRNLVKSRAHAYFLVGADTEDLVQEGMIGLYKAIRDFKPHMHTIFSAFAEICITRQIISAVKTATRYKHAPLNSYVSIDRPVYADESERTLQDVLTGEKDLNPEELVINEEAYKDMELRMNEVLSDLEWQVLLAYLEGKSYNETAESLNRPVKSVDNALQRIKHKLEEYVHARDGRNSIDR